MKIGLRIDVDTLRGTRDGVPRLCQLLKEEGITASFFFSVGPDNMGRHLWRLLKPRFLWKMLRSNAAGLYGWDILLCGAFWPGPNIGKRAASAIRMAAEDGHEIGLHAWDHRYWQAHIDRMTPDALHEQIDKGYQALKNICGKAPTCSAVPGWRCNQQTLLEKERFDFQYNSDCRGDRIFKPRVKSKVLKTPQIPVTLPTYDELIGTDGITDENYNQRLLAMIEPADLRVLTIHAEAEGGRCLEMFRKFMGLVRDRGDEFVSLGSLLETEQAWPVAEVEPREFPGREGWIACQGAVHE
jgi:undecaprenyl phosphate-alpha-L-ara4FN deformylase